MNESVARKSQETLGKVIKKPHLTEKLLSKPPFRFLHDIFTEVIRTTGFLKGLYGEAELKSDNVKDKDSKIAFLQKAIDAVMLVSGEPLAAKPVKIIAGQEPERTNELLQAIAKCCLSKLSSDEAVKRVLAGEKLSTSRSQDKENRQERKVTKEGSASRERESKKEDKEKRRDAERSKEKSRDREKHKERERDKEREKRRDRGPRREVEKEQEREKRSEREREKEKHKETEEIQEDRTDKKSRTAEETSTSHSEEPSQRFENAGAAEAQSPARIPRPSSAKGQRRRPTAGHQDHSDSDGDAEVPSRENIENGTVSDPALSQKTQRRPPRPSSARPAAPRVWRQDAEGSPAERLGSGKPSAPVIIEGKKLSEDEDEDDGQFVVEEAAPSASDLPEVQPSSLELEADGTHGGLVKKILETKKDYESSPSSKEQERWLVSEASRRKEREAVQKELERLRGAVQTVCRSALPLGKIMDYIQEDMDSMQKELQTWRQENKRHAQALLQEQRITDSVVDPLKAELTELEQSIRDQQDKICALKSIVLKNEEKIFRMVSSLSSSSQT